MSSKDFDTFLQLRDAQDRLLVENDDIDKAAKKTNSRIWFVPRADGVYRIVATSFQNQGRREYEIIVRQYGEKKRE